MNLNAEITNLMWIDITIYTDMIVNWLISYMPKIVGAILILWIGFKIIWLIETWIEKIMSKQKISPMLKSFTTSLTNILLKIMVIIAAAWMLWVQTSSFVAMLAAAWFAIGMALSWTLQNFAGWVIILLLKPFKIWDYVEVWWHTWTIKEISIFNTMLVTPDKKRIIIPNSDISNWSMTIYTAEPKRRIDLVIWVSYSENVDKVRKTLEEIVAWHEKVLKEEPIVIWLSALADSSVNFDFRFYVNSEDYLTTKYDILEAVKKTFDKKKISFPFPQRDIHIYNEK